MRHTITISGTSQIKNQRIHCKKLPNFQQESIVKIQQSDKKIYAIYTPDVNSSGSEKSLMSIKYLNLNNMEESLASISKMQTPTKLKYIEIQLSSIDYQLVNNNFSLLERSFLDQVNIVWPGAKIPLHYDQCNYITLIPKVKDVYLVDPYAAVSFIMMEQVQNQQDTKVDDEESDQQLQLGEKILILNNIDDRKCLKFGYDNVIYLAHEDFINLRKYKTNQFISSFLCTVEPSIPFVSNPTFEEFQEFRKLEAANKIPQLKPILLRIQSSRENQFQKQQQIQPQASQKEIPQQIPSEEIHFACSPVCKISLALPEKLVITDQTLHSFQVSETLSLEMFVKELSSKKYRISIKLPNPQNFNNETESKLKDQFACQFVKTLQLKREFIFFQDYFPFIMQNSVYSLTLQRKSSNKRDYEQLRNFLMIKNIQKQEMDQNGERYSKIKLAITNSIEIIPHLEGQKVTEWLSTIKWLSQNKLSELRKQKEDEFRRIFELSFNKQLTESIQFIQNQTRSQHSSAKILFSTYSSNGKTYLHHYFNGYNQSLKIHNCKQKSLRSWYLDCRSLLNTSNRFQEIKSYLNAFVTLCPYRLVFFDNIDVLIPLIEEGDQMRQKEKIIAYVLGNYLFALLQNNSKICIFTAKSQANIDPTFKFDKTIKLKNPNRQMRTQIIQSLNLDKEKGWLEQFVDKSESLSLGSVANYLIAQQIPSKNQFKRKNDFSKIVGLFQAKKVIRSVIEKPNKFGFIYEKVKIKVPRGILLYGATGNGKTALGSAVEDEFPMKYFSVKGSDILSKYIGGSEAAVRQIFEKALSVAPSIIFFDQFESIVPRRNSSGTGVTDRVVNQFLCYLDGVSSTTGIFIIAASSRPDLIDPALLRPGRIDSHIYLDYPTQEERAQLLKLFENSVKLEISEQEFVESTDRYSYSDLIGLLKQLRIKKSAQVLKENQNPQPDEFKFIPRQLFQLTVKSYRIGTGKEEQNKQKELFQKFKSGKGPEIKEQKFIQM